MRFRAALVVAVSFVGAGCASAPSADPERAAAAAPAAAEPTREEMDAAWQKYMAPGAQHARMAARTGTWDAKGKWWLEAGAPPTEGVGTATFRMILGGRYEVQEYRGAFMGMEFEGLSLSGYDNARRVWSSTWVDSMGTGVMNTEGTEDAQGVVTMRGTMHDPIGRASKVRTVMTDRDADTLFFEMFATNPDGTETKAMELTYKRRR